MSLIFRPAYACTRECIGKYENSHLLVKHALRMVITHSPEEKERESHLAICYYDVFGYISDDYFSSFFQLFAGCQQYLF